MEEEDLEQGAQVSLDAGRGKETDPPLDPQEEQSPADVFMLAQ